MRLPLSLELTYLANKLLRDLFLFLFQRLYLRLQLRNRRRVLLRCCLHLHGVVPQRSCKRGALVLQVLLCPC